MLSLMSTRWITEVKQETPYLLNIAFLVKTTNQKPRHNWIHTIHGLLLTVSQRAQFGGLTSILLHISVLTKSMASLWTKYHWLASKYCMTSHVIMSYLGMTCTSAQLVGLCKSSKSAAPHCTQRVWLMQSALQIASVWWSLHWSCKKKVKSSPDKSNLWSTKSKV